MAVTTPLLYAPLTHKVIGTFYDVYNEIGPGFPEFILRRAMAIALAEANLEVYEEVELPVSFRGRRIGTFRADLVVEKKLIVEVKVAPEVDRYHYAQVLHYLKATDLRVGLLLNFGRAPIYKRVAYETARNRQPIERPSPEEIEQTLNGSDPSAPA